MTRPEWNALVSRYTAALVARVNTHDPALVQARDQAVADALLVVLRGFEHMRFMGSAPGLFAIGAADCGNCGTKPCLIEDAGIEKALCPAWTLAKP